MVESMLALDKFLQLERLFLILNNTLMVKLESLYLKIYHVILDLNFFFNLQ
jgi:hypothetical protein